MRFEKKLNKLLWFIVALLPLIYSVIYMFNQSTNVSLSVYLTDFIALFGNGFIYDYLLDFIGFFGINSIFITLLCCYINYLIIVCLMKLAYKVILLLVTICNSFLDRFGGNKNE